jgi:hypothetical protein
MTSSLEWVGLATATLSAVQYALGAVRRRPWRRLARQAPGAGGSGVEKEPFRCQVPWVVRFEAADGSVLTVWAAGPVPGACREESGRW